MIIQDSYVIECLRDYPEESLHDNIETVADIIYGDYIENRWLYELLYIRCAFIP